MTEVKVRFKFIDKVILENIAPLIELNDKSFKQVRFSPRLDYVPILDKEKLIYYQAEKKYLKCIILINIESNLSLNPKT